MNLEVHHQKMSLETGALKVGESLNKFRVSKEVSMPSPTV